ncbi:MAG: DUF503 domain-containing protein [Anaerolineales bacterium]|nr:DUF503 domain-containing protein [Anaerolineales bacterium]
MHVGALSIDLYLPASNSLKDKRRTLKPLLARLHKEFNISVAEIELNDHHRSAAIACVVVSNDSAHVQQMLEKIARWVVRHRPDLQVVDHQITLL